jgi:superfamily II DNA or RNA helicase
MQFKLDDVLDNFDDNTFGRGAEMARRGSVRKIKLGDALIKGVVHGSGNRVYEQDISLRADTGGVDFEGDCTCVGGYNCKHVVAVLLTHLRQQEKPARPAQAAPVAALPNALAVWLQRLDAAARPKPPVSTDLKDPNQIANGLIYVLAPDNSGKHVALCLCKARLRPNGDVVSASAVTEVFSLLSNIPSYMEEVDEDLVRFFVAMRSGVESHGGTATEPKGRIGASLLQLLVEQKKLLWANSWSDLANGMVYPMKAAPKRQAHLGWREGESEALRLAWQVQTDSTGNGGTANHAGAHTSHELDYILPTDPPWYIDNLSCGELTLVQGNASMSLQDLQALVAQAPPLAAKDKTRLSQRLLAHGLQNVVPLPEQVQQVLRTDVKPQPILLLGSMPHPANAAQGKSGNHRWYDFGSITFDYDGESVSLDPSQQVVRQCGAAMEVIQRDEAAETAAYRSLIGYGFVPPKDPASPLKKMMGAMQMRSQADWLRFAKEGPDRLVAAGWRVEKTPEYRFDVLEIEDWYANVAEPQGQLNGHSANSNAWFDLELGVVVNQVRVALLPVLVQLIRNAPNEFNPKALAAHADADQMLATLPDGGRVGLPWGRIKPILSTLGELYFNDKLGPAIRLPALDVARLAELEQDTQLRWLGGDEQRAMGRKLREFGGVQKVDAPQGLRATLRDYQSEGLAWMQFLREYDLAGILADDMGLGKTIQTLAHILIEKEAGRLTKPALVVAPTSLMDNWQTEAARFAPDLRVLLLQGIERLERFDQIAQSDLVLTTYALLPRDEEKLLQYEFHLVILDESHYIKNTRSKAAQTAGMLHTRHRLCLTGTPLENHLGELWSQFHFLLPGLLGDEKSFNNEFRNPIEKLGDDVRRSLLSRRIKPFLLRRTKDKVAKELPPKTEMVRHVELTGSQRDLYETVRLAMDKKVRDEIAKKGVARSQIVILEALLKLRQVCCDPRLVKASAAKKTAPTSAKLTELMTMIEELLEEGRKILVFSQFTSMLQLIEQELEARTIGYALLTGDTKDRAAQVTAFQQGAVPIFLVSLKAGGVGLNLTAADTVIHYDPWWNPAAENQATDRAWRIGQDKPVFVYKLIAKGTLEEKIQALQHRKSELADSMLGEGEAQNMKVTQEDLQMIFAPLEG